MYCWPASACQRAREGGDRWWGWAWPGEGVLIIALLSCVSLSTETSVETTLLGWILRSRGLTISYYLLRKGHFQSNHSLSSFFSTSWPSSSFFWSSLQFSKKRANSSCSSWVFFCLFFVDYPQPPFLFLNTGSSILIFLQSFQPVGILKFPSDQTDKFFSSSQYLDQTEQTWNLV